MEKPKENPFKFCSTLEDFRANLPLDLIAEYEKAYKIAGRKSTRPSAITSWRRFIAYTLHWASTPQRGNYWSTIANWTWDE